VNFEYHQLKIIQKVQSMKKQLFIFLGIFLFLTIGMHFKEWTSYSIDHIMTPAHAGAYEIGMLYPLVFAFLGYVVFLLVMDVVYIIKKIVAR